VPIDWHGGDGGGGGGGFVALVTEVAMPMAMVCASVMLLVQQLPCVTMKHLEKMHLHWVHCDYWNGAMMEVAGTRRIAALYASEVDLDCWSW
jgi:hypothetical protein